MAAALGAVAKTVGPQLARVAGETAVSYGATEGLDQVTKPKEKKPQTDDIPTGSVKQ